MALTLVKQATRREELEFVASGAAKNLRDIEEEYLIMDLPPQDRAVFEGMQASLRKIIADAAQQLSELEDAK